MDESKAGQRKGFRAGLPVLVVFAATGLFQLPFFDLWFSMMDEGHMLQFADLRLRGGEFYRDATFYPLPGAFHFLALVFQVFGASILISRWVVLLEFALFVALFFYLIRKITSTSWALVGVGCLWLYRVWCFPHWQIYSYSTTSLLVFLGSITALVLYLERRERRMLAFAGFLFGLGVLCKQDYGAAVMIAVLVCLFVFVRSEPSGDRPSYASVLLTFLLPAAVVGAFTGLYYWRVGVLGDLLQFTVFNHFAGMGQYEYSEFPGLFPLFGQDLALRTKLSITEFMPGIMMTADWSTLRAHPLFTDTALYEFCLKLFFFGPQVFLGAVAFRAWTTRGQLRSGQASPQRLRFLVQFLFLCLGSAFIFLAWINKPQDYVHLAVLYWPLIFLAIGLAHGGLA
ncbi:MAG: glycosyltransferase family 39 protein, partial [Myxococcota bacterium]|nr:glycosyltransferase family 39 protein [Myxococcota bacterium]